MCGILGAFRLTQRAFINKTLLWHIAVLMQSRGKDATGFAWMTNENVPEYVKGPGSARELARTYIFGTMPKSSEISAVIGHCRATTHGSEKINANNHPHFSELPDRQIVSIVHNGVAPSYEAIAKRENAELGTDCDSEIFSALFAKYAETMDKPVEILGKIIETVSSGAVIYMTPDGIGFHRIGSNPLYIGSVSEVAYLSSVKDYLLDIGCSDATEVKEDTPVWFPKAANGAYYLKAEVGPTIKRATTSYVTTNYRNWKRDNPHRAYHGIVSTYKAPVRVRFYAYPKEQSLKDTFERIQKSDAKGAIPLAYNKIGEVTAFYDPNEKAFYEFTPETSNVRYHMGGYYELMQDDEGRKKYPPVATPEEKEDKLVHGSIITVK